MTKISTITVQGNEVARPWYSLKKTLRVICSSQGEGICHNGSTTFTERRVHRTKGSSTSCFPRHVTPPLAPPSLWETSGHKTWRTGSARDETAMRWGRSLPYRPRARQNCEVPSTRNADTAATISSPPPVAHAPLQTPPTCRNLSPLSL